MSRRAPISTATFAERLEDPAHSVVDVRPLAAYNGWRLAGEARGGHATGARSLPVAWTRFMDWVEVVEEKGLVPGRPVTVYGYTPDESTDMADHLARLGFEDVDVYDAFVAEWSGDPGRPLSSLPRYRQRVHAGWLHARLNDPDADADAEADADADADTDGSPDLVVCHAHFDNPDDYAIGHIPGAFPLDTNALESPETWNRRSPAELAEALRGLGIRHDTTVVLYGRHSFPTYDQPQPGQSAGQLAAMRCALILLYAGVEDVRVLDGGIHAWLDAGHPLSTDAPAPRRPADFGVDIPAHPEYIVDLPDARRLIAAASGELVSVRSWPEFIGERSGYHYIEKTGRIPGAIFGNGGTDAYHMENYRNLDYTSREFGEVARRWAEAGITPDKHIAFYCGTGWRASEAFMNAYCMGWPRISIYDGGWYEWSADPANPVETGIPGANPGEGATQA